MAVTRKYAQINACTNEVVLIGDESLGMPVADSNLVYTINISSHSQKDEIDVYWTYSKTTELFTAPSKDPLPIPVIQEIIADSAEKSETETDTIVLTLSQAYMTGTVVKFVAPCDCVGISKINILDKTFSIVDAVGNKISEISGNDGGVFSQGAVIAVALNANTMQAFIQNSAKCSKFRRELIWENENVITAFSPIDISLSQTYDVIEVQYAFEPTWASSCSMAYAQNGGKCELIARLSGVYGVRSRSILYSNDKIKIGNGGRYGDNGGFTIDDNIMIPRKIYGIKY